MERRYFHYTTEKTHIDKIIKSGLIKTAKAGVTNKKEKPIAWISTNENWEHTTTKYATNNFGKPFLLSFEEQLEYYGCARIEVNPKGFIFLGKIKAHS